MSFIQLPIGRPLGNYPETGFWEVETATGQRHLNALRAKRKLMHCRRRLIRLEVVVGGVLVWRVRNSLDVSLRM